MTVAQRIAEVLSAVAYGDAFGMPVEMFSREKIVGLGGVHELLPGHPDNPISGTLAAGQVTDDTIVTEIVARVVVAGRGEVDPVALLREVAAWSRAHPDLKVIGPSTLRALDELERGTPLDRMGLTGDTDGAAMRITPVGVVCSVDDLDALVATVAHSCRATHHTSVGISAASAIAAGIAYGVGGGASVSGMVDACQAGAEAGRRRGVPGCWPRIADRIDLALKLSARHADDDAALDALHHRLGTTVLAADAVPAAVALAARADGDVHRAAWLAANVGGDTDTIAALACALTAAVAGGASMRPDVLDAVLAVNHLDFGPLGEQLAQVRAERLAAARA